MHRACLLHLLAVLLALIGAGRVHAQATQGTLPDPITTPELMRYADRLGLSGEQRRAAERLHDEYREEFRALREGEIAQFMDSMRGMTGMMPERRAFEDFMRRWERLYDRIAQLDDRLFVRMQEILTDHQLVMLPRVRQARERQRYSGGMQQMMMMGGPLVDLTTIVDAVNMHPAERAAIDPALAAYEHRLTAAMRDMHKGANRLYSDMFDAFEQAGITDEMMQDPEQMGEMMEAMEHVITDMFERMMKQSRELTELSEGAFRTMRPHLSEETARAFRNMFYGQAYPGVNFALRLPVEAKLETAISLEQISEPTRDALIEMLAQARLRADRILDDAIELQKQQQENFSPFSMEEFDWEEHHRQMSELQRSIMEINREANERMLAAIGKEVDEETQQKVAEATHEQARPRTPRSPFAGHVTDDDDPPVQRSRHDQHLPAAISRHEVTIYARMLDLDEARLAVVDELHASYLERFEEMTSEKFAALSEARTKVWQQDTEEAAVDHLSALRRQTMEAILEADESFFEEIALAVLESDDDLDRLDRVRAARLRAAYSTRTNHWGMHGRYANATARVDLARLVRLASLPEQELTRIDDLLADYQFEAAEAQRLQFEAALALEEAQQRWNIVMMRAQRDGNQFEHAMRWQEAMREPTRALSEASQRLADLNEATIEELLARLRGDYAAKLDESYRRRAFPGVYNDSAAVDKQLTSALRLPDLTEQQRSHLAELIGEYRPAYVDLTERMVERVRTSSAEMPEMDFQGEQWQRYMDAMETIERLRFERNELNARAIGRLRSILNDVQITALGPLPEPPEESTNMWGF